MATVRTVTGKVLRSGEPYQRARVKITPTDIDGNPVDAYVDDENASLLTSIVHYTDEDGEFTVNLFDSRDVTPVGTVYWFEIGSASGFAVSATQDGSIDDMVVTAAPDLPSPFRLDDLADVNTDGATDDGDVLTWDETDGEWQAKAPTGGSGVPPGGTTGQVLRKQSNADGDADWSTLTASDVGADPAGTAASAVASHEADTTNVHGIADTTALETTSGAQAKVDAHVNDSTAAHAASAISIADAGNDFDATDVEGALAELQADHEADAQALSNHSSATTNVHGIPDTAQLATDSDVSTAITNHTNAADPHGDRAYTDQEIADLIAEGTAIEALPTATDTDTDDQFVMIVDGQAEIASPALARDTLNVEDGADVTDAINVDAAGAVMESDYDANTILKADSDNTPTALTVAEQRLVGRITGGVIDALTASQVRTLLNVEDGATADMSAAEILAALLTVDGAGSGLDADTVDGLHASSFSAIVADDPGIQHSGSTSPTSLFASGISKPAPMVNDYYRLRMSGIIINLTGGEISSTITCAYGGQNMWTPFAIAVPGLNAVRWVATIEISVEAVHASTGAEVVVAEFRANGNNVETPDVTRARLLTHNLINLNNTGAMPVTLTATHTDANANFSTALYRATLERVRRNF